jgi:hypothetical protein
MRAGDEAGEQWAAVSMGWGSNSDANRLIRSASRTCDDTLVKRLPLTSIMMIVIFAA